jgi:uncharacterized protein YggE
MRTALAAGLAALALAAPAAAQTPTPTPDTSPTIAADGVGIAALAPDIASFTVSVQGRARSAVAARSAANKIARTVVRAATEAGVAASDIRTLSVTTGRTRVKPKGRRAYTRYTARQYMAFVVRDVAKIGPLIDAASDAGATNIDGPEFGFADPSQGRLLATRAAIADARRRADDAAAQTGLRIVSVRSVVLAPDDDNQSYGDSGGGGAAPASGGSDESEDAATTVSAGVRQFVEQVRVVFNAVPL